MASRPIFSPFQCIVNGNMASNITSAVTIIQNLSMLSYDISWAGSSPVGNIVVEVSNTYTQNADGTVRNPGNWTAITLSSSTSVSGNSGTGFIDIDAIASYAIRIRYVATSGSGTLNATINGKVQ
jgi:Flp pilus assembly protein TadG